MPMSGAVDIHDGTFLTLLRPSMWGTCPTCPPPHFAAEIVSGGHIVIAERMPKKKKNRNL